MLEAAQPMKKPADDTEYLEEDPNFGQTSQAYSGQSMAEEPQDLHQLVEHAGLDENAVCTFKIPVSKQWLTLADATTLRSARTRQRIHKIHHLQC